VPVKKYFGQNRSLFRASRLCTQRSCKAIVGNRFSHIYRYDKSAKQL